jgi:hypothetical protein
VVLQCCCSEFIVVYCGGLEMFVSGLRVTYFSGTLIGLW